MASHLHSVKENELPFGMVPAPVKERRVSPPIDLGAYDEKYAGWMVVYDLDIGLDVYEKLAAAQDAEGGVESLHMMREWMEQVLVAWNFSKVQADGTVALLPQPRDGGIGECSPALLGPIAQAFGAALQPDKSETE